jgi:DNA-binding PadR family transcriptional regulator
MAIGEPRLTSQTLKVLALLTARAEPEMSGADIGRATKLASGTLYPILFRLEQARWVESHWETEDPQQLGRPRRRLYRITGMGARRAESAIRDLVSPLKEFAWL